MNMIKFTIPSYEELIISTFNDLKVWEDRLKNETNPHLKKSYQEYVDYLKSILEGKVEEIREIKIKSLLDE